MKINILTLFPNMFNGFLTESIMKRAQDKKRVFIEINNLRDYSTDKHKHVDDTPYGGGAGMVLKCEPVYNAIEDLKKENTKVVMLTPQGIPFTQRLAYKLSEEEHLILLCGHYEGFDERISSMVDMEISIGDYVLTGGEIPAMVVADSVTRLVPGVIEEESHLNDSFNDNLLDYPQYTKPQEFNGMKVPDVLLSGDHKKIEEWRENEAIKKTEERRPDLIKKVEDNEYIKKEEIKRKQVGNYSLIDDNKPKTAKEIKIKESYNFLPKRKFSKKELDSISKVVLVEPSFVSNIAKKNISKKLEILLGQVKIVLNDETDDEGANYVLGELERLESIMMANYAKYLDISYITLVQNKIDLIKNEINLKLMMRVETVDYNKGRSR